MNRYPDEVTVTWLQSRPEIRIKLVGTDHGEIVFKTDEPSELLGKVVHAYANLFLHSKKLERENRSLRRNL